MQRLLDIPAPIRGNLVQVWRATWPTRRFIATSGFCRSSVHPEMKIAPDFDILMTSTPAPGGRARAAPNRAPPHSWPAD